MPAELQTKGSIPNTPVVVIRPTPHRAGVTVFNSLFGRCLIVAILGLWIALLQAKRADPYRRIPLNFKTAEGASVEGIAVLPKLAGKFPAVIFFYGASEDLARSGNVLRKAADVGLAGICLEYDKTDRAKFEAQLDALLKYLPQQPWINANEITWVGFSLGARGSLDYCLTHPQSQPKLLVRISSGESEELDRLKSFSGPAGNTPLRSQVLLINGSEDEVFSPDECRRVAQTLRACNVPVDLIFIDHQSHSLGNIRPLVFRLVMEYAAAKMNVSASAPPAVSTSWLYPALVILLACVLAYSIIPAAFGWFRRIRSRRSAGEMLKAVAVIASLSVVAWLMGSRMILVNAPITAKSLSLAKKFLVDPKSYDDFDALAAAPCWKGQKIGTLLDHLSFSELQKRQFYTELETSVYRKYLLSPIIAKTQTAEVNWRQELWRFFYPRIREDPDPQSAALSVATALREQIWFDPGFDSRSGVDGLWARKFANQDGFNLLYVAALRSVGIAARLNDQNQAELWADRRWQPAPPPPITLIAKH
jgi:dienelactone hydrolase